MYEDVQAEAIDGGPSLGWLAVGSPEVSPLVGLEAENRPGSCHGIG